MNTNEADLTLERVESAVWPDPPADASRLVRTVHALRRKPIQSMTIEDLRIMLGQEVGIDTLMPYALAVLEKNPLAQGDFFPGDLLLVTVRISVEYWAENRELSLRLSSVIDRFREINDLDDDFSPYKEIWQRIDYLRDGGIL